ncbi:hypothetical protein CKO22_18310 [Thiococcus pfennigii]|nr:hypothetical protein [Thiococcus pfennigii]
MVATVCMANLLRGVGADGGPGDCWPSTRDRVETADGTRDYARGTPVQEAVVRGAASRGRAVAMTLLT